MNFNRKKLIIFLGLVLIITSVMLTACSPNSSDNEKAKQTGTVTFSIKGYNDMANYEATEVPITKEMTALDLLSVTEFAVSISNDEFVTSIDGLENGSVEGYPYCGWVYYVNDEFANVGAEDYVLKDGDIIDWVFSLTYDN